MLYDEKGSAKSCKDDCRRGVNDSLMIFFWKVFFDD